MKEIWKVIPWCAEWYQASNKWRIRRIPHYWLHATGKKVFKDYRYLKWYIRNKAYRYVEILWKSYWVHRLVCAAFHWLNLEDPKMYACHKNDIRDDNREKNLFPWTAQDNIDDCILKWRNNFANETSLKRWSLHNHSKLKEGQVIEIKKQLWYWANITKLSKIYNVSYSTIYAIKKWTRWGWL
mgnify:CR=1 FL=1